VKECQEIAKNVPVQLDYLDTSCIEHFAEVQQYLDLMKIPFTINPRIVRGLDYYTNTAFEVIYEGIGAQNALAGGGRYNGLIEQIGGKNIPAVGFAGGFERLLLALEEEAIALPGHPVPEVFIITIGSEAQKIIIPYLNIIRGKGIYAEYEPDRASLKAQLKAANNSKAFYALIMGEEEVKQKSAILKNLESGEQKLYSLEPISHLIKAIQNKEI
jgi:histidyl-tRNA synthetase